MDEPGGRQQGPEGLFTCGKAPASLCTRKRLQLVGRTAGGSRGPLGPYRARVQSRSPDQGLKVGVTCTDRENEEEGLCYVGINMGSADRIKMELPGNPGLIVDTPHPENAAFERNLLGG